MFSICHRGRICSLFTIHDQISKLDVAGSTPVSRSNFSTTYKNLFTLCAPFVLRLHHLQAFLYLINCRQPVLDRRLRIYVLVHIEAMAELIGHEFPIHSQRPH